MIRWKNKKLYNFEINLITSLVRLKGRCTQRFRGVRLEVRLGMRFQNRETLWESGVQEIGVRLSLVFMRRRLVMLRRRFTMLRRRVSRLNPAGYDD